MSAARVKIPRVGDNGKVGGPNGTPVDSSGLELPGSTVSDSSAGDVDAFVQAANGHKIRKYDRDFWRSADFGATFKGDDYTTELINAVGECQLDGKKLRLVAGVAGVSGPLVTDMTEDLYVQGEGPLTIIEHDSTTDALFQLQGGLAPVGSMPSGAAAGDLQIVMDSTAGIQKGDLLWLRDPAGSVDGEDTSGGTRKITVATPGEKVVVKSVDDSTHFTPRGPLLWSYGTSADVRVQTGPRCGFSDMWFRNPNDAGDTTAARAFLLNYCIDVRVSGITTELMSGASVYLQGCSGHLTDLLFLNSQDLEEPGLNPYGIVLGRGCSHVLVEGVRQWYGRHLITTASSATEIPPQLNDINGCQAYFMSQAAFDTHPGARWHTFRGITASQCGAYGAQLRGPDCSIYDYDIFGVGAAGVFVANGADRAQIGAGRIRRAPYGIRNRNSDDMRINGGVDMDEIAIAHVYVETPSGGWTGHVNDFDMDNADLRGNPSTASIWFDTGAWKPGMRIGPGVRMPDATTKLLGVTFPDTTAAASIAVPA